MRVVFAGTPEPALPSLDAIAASPHELVGVVTRPDAPAGRGRRLTPSPVAERADELGVPVLKPDHPRDPEFQEALRALAPDCCPVVAYGALLPQSALDIPTHGWVNLHFSVLPAWRGAAPVQHAAVGRRRGHRRDDVPDRPRAGRRADVRADDRAGAPRRHRRLAAGAARRGRRRPARGHPRRLEIGSLEAREQPEDGISFAPKITVEDAHVDWTEPAMAVDRRIRACTPAPGAWTTYEGERVKLGPVTPADGALPPGELLVGKNAVAVGTGTGALKLGLVKAFGKKEMPAADWARGIRVEPGARFGD